MPVQLCCACSLADVAAMLLLYLQVLAAKQPTNSSSGTGSPGSDDLMKQDAGSTATTSANVSGSGTPLQLAVPSSCVAAAGAAVSRQQCGLHTRVLTQGGLVLGYLSFDGEGTRSDKQEAVRCFKLAAQAGCKEAQQVLGWIFNTGQY
jgi:hypothetical protein